MQISQTYYQLKPLIPFKIRIALRRRLARKLRKMLPHTWPIDESAGRQPHGWQGWPEGKLFALVLTHDVEGACGLAQCEDLMKMESDLGFRSSFNLVPEGSDRVDRETREMIKAGGFELGVHDLKHNGKLFTSRKSFASKALHINRYLEEWNACGFRAGLMHHNLDWIKDLQVTYDASTFDTDPFEPQPDGTRTLPFWVPRQNGSGYVELPVYAAPGLQSLHRPPGKLHRYLETKAGLDRGKGRDGSINVHPDYMNFSDRPCGPKEYPASRYREFLEYVRSRYEGKYWHTLPRTVAGYIADEFSNKRAQDGDIPPKAHFHFWQPRKLWIDLDNTPHVPFSRADHQGT